MRFDFFLSFVWLSLFVNLVHCVDWSVTLRCVRFLFLLLARLIFCPMAEIIQYSIEWLCVCFFFLFLF
jgi:hypothetical protein